MRNVLLYGDSIFLSGLMAQLQSQPHVSAHQQAPGAGPLDLCNLDAVIVDFNAVDTAAVLDLLRMQPNLRVIGINAPGGAVTVLSSKVYLAHSLTDIVALFGN